MTKKLLSILTAAAMLCTMMVMSAGAVENPEEYTSGDYKYKMLANGTAKITEFLGKEDASKRDVTIPSDLNGVTVTVIGKEAFWQCNYIETVVIPETVTKVESFISCKQLKTVRMTDSVKTVVGFEFCENLEEINISKKTRRLFGFIECPKLKAVNIPKTVREVNNSFLYGCPNTKLTFDNKNSYLTFKNHAILADNQKRLIWFDRRNKYGTYTVPKTVETIGRNAFSMAQIKRIKLPAGLKEVEARAFDTCTAKFMNMPETIKTFGEGAFAGINVKELTIGKNAKVGQYAFAYSEKLERVTVKSGVVLDDSVFTECLNLHEFRIAKSVKLNGYPLGYRDDDAAYQAIEKITVFGYADSPAAEYAKLHRINFAELKGIADAKVTGIKNKKYTKSVKKSGARQKIKVYVKKKLLKKGRDYTVSYQDNKKRGKAKIIITGINKYDGIVKRSFRIK